MDGVQFTNSFDWRFVWEVFKRFIEGNYIWIIFIVIFLIFLVIGDAAFKKVYIYPFLFQLLTVFNPIILELLGERLDLAKRFYRFFWLLPIIPVVAFGITSLMFKIPKKKIVKICIFLCMTCIIMKLGTPIYTKGISPEYQRNESAFYMDQDIESISRIFHARGIEEPLVLYDQNLVLNYRQFDPTVLSYLGRNTLSKFQVELRAKRIKKILKRKKRRKIIELVYVREYMEVPHAVFSKAVAKSGIQYIAVQSEKETMIQYMDACGFSREGITDYYTVFFTG